MTGRNPINLHAAGALLERRGLAMMEAAACTLIRARFTHQMAAAPGRLASGEPVTEADIRGAA